MSIKVMKAVIVLLVALVVGMGIWAVPGNWLVDENDIPAPNATSTSGGGQGILPYNSGVSGVVMVGPTCPVVQYPPQGECDDKPLSTLVAIFRESDMVQAIVLTQSDKEGKFTAALAPGNYIVGAGKSQMPSCAQTPVKIEPSQYVSITINCDSGIR